LHKTPIFSSHQVKTRAGLSPEENEHKLNWHKTQPLLSNTALLNGNRRGKKKAEPARTSHWETVSHPFPQKNEIRAPPHSIKNIVLEIYPHLAFIFQKLERPQKQPVSRGKKKNRKKKPKTNKRTSPGKKKKKKKKKSRFQTAKASITNLLSA
jgi:hypothetical protein